MILNISYETYQLWIAILIGIIIFLSIITIKQYIKNKKYRNLDSGLLNNDQVAFMDSYLKDDRSINKPSLRKYPENEVKLNNLLTKEEENFIDDFYKENPEFKT